MAENKITVCSISTAAQMQKIVEENFERDRYTVYKWRTGPMASLPQVALAHIWLKKWVAHIYRKKEGDVTKEEVEKLKRQAKFKFYLETSESFVMEWMYDAMAPDKKSLQPTSITDWGHEQMFLFMEWMQYRAAEGGLALESIGEHKKLKKEQYGR